MSSGNSVATTICVCHVLFLMWLICICTSVIIKFAGNLDLLWSKFWWTNHCKLLIQQMIQQLGYCAMCKTWLLYDTPERKYRKTGFHLNLNLSVRNNLWMGICCSASAAMLVSMVNDQLLLARFQWINHLCCQEDTYELITTTLCIWQDSSYVMACTKNCSNIIAKN